MIVKVNRIKATVGMACGTWTGLKLSENPLDPKDRSGRNGLWDLDWIEKA